MFYSNNSPTRHNYTFFGLWFRHISLGVSQELYQRFLPVQGRQAKLLDLLRDITQCPETIELRDCLVSCGDDTQFAEPTVILLNLRIIGTQKDVIDYVQQHFNIINSSGYGYRIEEIDMVVLSHP